MDACTVTALDAITAFAVPNPNCPSQSRRFFQVWLLFRFPRCNRAAAMDQNQETQAVESSLLSEWEIKFFPIFHSHIHRLLESVGKNYKPCALEIVR